MAPHRLPFAGGVVAALVVVGARVALPWSLHAALRSIASDNWITPTSSSGWASSFGDPLVTGAACFLLLLIAMGYADYRERLSFARFSIGFVHDLRSTAVGNIRRRSAHDANSGVRHGDAIARLIGDTARIKAGIKGFLIHVATNGAMMLGVAVVLLVVDPALGLAFAGGILLVAGVTWRGASAIYRRAAQYREKEGRLAEAIHATDSEEVGSDSFSTHSSESASHEARITLLQGRTTWAAHVIFGLTVVACLWIGIRGVHGGRIEASSMVMFVLYALMMRAPLVQLSRQGVRTGKIIASLERVLEIAEVGESHPPCADSALAPLTTELRINDLRVRRGKGAGRRSTLRVDGLALPAGQRIAIVGAHGSGKTTLLQVLAGAVAMNRGELIWDGRALGATEARVLLAGQTRLLSVMPSWPRRPLREILAVPPGMSDASVVEVLRACGAKHLVRRWPKGLDTRLASEDLSLGERKQIALAGALIAANGASILLIDDLTAGTTSRTARKMLSATFKYVGRQTLVMSFSRPAKLLKFDRVIELDQGRIAFDSTPEAWKHRMKFEEPSLAVAAPGSSEVRDARMGGDGGPFES